MSCHKCCGSATQPQTKIKNFKLKHTTKNTNKVYASIYWFYLCSNDGFFKF